MADEVTLDLIAVQQRMLMDRFEELVLELRKLLDDACMFRSIVRAAVSECRPTTNEITTADDLVALLKSGRTGHIYRHRDGTYRADGQTVSASAFDKALKRRLIQARWDSKGLWCLPERIAELRAAAKASKSSKTKRVRVLEATQ